MRFLLLLFLYNSHISAWKISNWFYSDDHPKHSEIGTTGRVLVAMLGYPRSCERKGVSHACTLSVACWWVGGSSQSGCGGYPWIIACCVKSYPKEQLSPHFNSIYDGDDPFQHLDTPPNLENSILQRRNDDLEDECGLSSDRILLKRIIGGNEAKFAQYPWQAHIKISSYQCGGVLVSLRFVATAAHCIIRSRVKDISVHLGELDTQNTGKVFEWAPPEKHKVRRKIIHPKFKYRVTQPDRYDVALLELSKSAGQGFHIYPICLPEAGTRMAGRQAIVSGWGKIKPSNELTGTNVLRSAVVPILDVKECMSWHRIKQITVQLHEEMLCAGYKDGRKDACLGDSGGPLITLINGRWTLAGIISAGYGCGESHQPGIYHSVAVTANWMRSTISS